MSTKIVLTSAQPYVLGIHQSSNMHSTGSTYNCAKGILSIHACDRLKMLEWMHPGADTPWKQVGLGIG